MASAGAAVPWYLAGGVAAANCKAAYQPIGAASLAASYTNLANPGTYDAAPGTAPSHASATGWTFNGTTQYLDTGYAPPNQAAISMLVRFSDGITTGGGGSLLLVTSNGALNLGLTSYSSLFGTAWFVANGGSSTPAGVASGVLGMTGTQGYLNGAAYGASYTGTGAASHRTFYIGAYHGASPSFFWPGKVQAVAIYSVNLTVAQMLAISTAMAGLTG